MASITLVHTNDLHGRLTREKLPFLLSLRDSADLYFDSGDCVKSGNLALPMKPDPAWALLHEARCDASCPGNRESHPLASGMKAKFAGAMHPVLCANWKDKNGAQVFEPSHVWTVKGVRVAAFGVMVPIVTDRMTTRAASNYLWDQPVPCAVEVAGALRKKADVVVALTHIGIAQDRKLAEATSDIDVIFGGHSHTVIEAPEVVNGVAICQGGSHAQFVGRYVIEPGKGVTRAELLPWP